MDSNNNNSSVSPENSGTENIISTDTTAPTEGDSNIVEQPSNDVGDTTTSNPPVEPEVSDGSVGSASL